MCIRDRTLTVQNIADLIDHALLKPDLPPDEVAHGVAEVAALQAWSVCVRPSDVAAVARQSAEAHTCLLSTSRSV